MVIAVNTRFLGFKELEGYGYFTKEVFIRIAKTHQEHSFIFFFDRAIESDLVLPSNVTPVIIPPKARHALSFKWWYDVKIPIALKKYKADVFVSPDGFCSLTTSVPQVLVVHDLAFIRHPKFIPTHHLYYYKQYTAKFLRKAKFVATVSEFSKQDIIKQYKIAESKLAVVGSAAKPVFKPLEWDHKQAIKDKYTEGCEYFVFVSSIHPRKNLLNLLKAFSLFKIRQRSSMKLVIVGKGGWQYDDIVEKLKAYKFREEVKMIGYVEETELARIVASAYALVYPSFFEGFGVPIVEAMQSGVPVITSDKSSMPEVGGSAAAYADPNNPDAIAEQLKLLYKDELLRNQMIEQGYIQAQNFSWAKTASLVWHAIEQAVSK